MNEDPKHFREYLEVASRPHFDSTISITLENFQSLVGPYSFPDDVPCQVEKDAATCGQPHRNGWLAKTKGQKEGLVGGICAKKYFGANSEFTREQNRVRRTLNIRQYLGQLSELLADRDEVLHRVDAQIIRIRRLWGLVRQVEKEMSEIARRLRGMAKSGNRTIMIEVQQFEEDEKGKKHPVWRPQRIGAISGLNAWDEFRVREVRDQLHLIRNAAESAELSEGAGERRLKGWVDVLSELPRYEARIGELEQDSADFFNYENLTWLCFLVRSEKVKEVAARFALRFNGSESPSAKESVQLVKSLSAEVKRNLNGLNYRVAQ